MVLPELTALRGVEQSRFHHLDVHAHTLAVLAATIELERDGAELGEHRLAVRRFMEQPLANELTRWQALRFGALLHDIAKPQTRSVTPEGRVTFIGHDTAGGETARAVLARLRASDRLAEHVAALARHHLHLGFLVHEVPLSRRDDLPLPAPVLAGARRRHRAERRRPAGDPRETTPSRRSPSTWSSRGQMLGEALRWVAGPPAAAGPRGRAGP